MDPLTQIMTTEEASKLWGVHQDHVKRWCREGKVRCRKFGKTYILTKDQPKPGTVRSMAI
ncbi:helix-turn-helix domain-containing protein [Cohnella nanjingensis]|uniref:Helix-turn-helix domain-containing protein n=2 Tax=Cohnella nanjingensis TaxID=1387779 RepID=A0A7X0VH06_9BACL|nr:helix-turn-helix domain-containing protein [Cohnella nanjingensis]